MRIRDWVVNQEVAASAGRENFLPDWSLYQKDNPVPQALEKYANIVPSRHKGGYETPRQDGTQRYLLTAAQDDTDIHKPFWANLNAYARDIGAQVIVAGFTYQHALFTDHETRSGLFREGIQPFMRFDQVNLGPVVFAAEMNVLPTAVNPLSGLDAYTGSKWGVFPHAKVCLQAVAASVDGLVKHNLTTGCVTVENYIKKKAGLRAAFHHVIGAVIVEVCEDGVFFCRHINATREGDFQDLDVIVRDGRVTRGHRVEAVNWGDLHREVLDPDVARGAFGIAEAGNYRVEGESSILDVLKPRFCLWHDSHDFKVRNHHNRKDPHFMFEMHVQDTESIETDIRLLADFFGAVKRDFSQDVVVQSNHDNALLRWLKETTPNGDPVNARFWLACSTAIYEAIEEQDEGFSVFPWALRRARPDIAADLIFVTENESFMICQGAPGGGVECSQHGHLGVNGARGSPSAFDKTSMKMNIGHAHSAHAQGGIWRSGVCALLRLGYNSGLSTWSHSHVVTYASGKRAIITMQGGRWRADPKS